MKFPLVIAVILIATIAFNVGYELGQEKAVMSQFEHPRQHLVDVFPGHKFELRIDKLPAEKE